MADPYGWIRADLESLHRVGWYRTTRTHNGLAGPQMDVDGKPVLQFASNDYLGLSGDERLIEAACRAVRLYGAGATGSRLLSGERDVHRELEQALAGWKGCDDCLVFSSGYLANLGTIPALVGKRDLVVGDEYNHACLRGGAELSGAVHRLYPHGDCSALESLLIEQRERHRRCLICTDSVFSMDGDLIDLARIADLARRYGCMLLVDEAHATGVLGPTGAGAVEQLGLTRSLVQMGTLSKALGSQGGYVCGSAELVDYLRNRARSFVYTTGLAPAAAAAALEAVHIARTETPRRALLRQNIARLRAGIDEIGIAQLPSDAAILCLWVGDIEATHCFAGELFEEGIFAPAVRPPTVPTSRIRLSLMATHTEAMIDSLIAALTQVSSRFS
ncbi:8-amino-7-oxononanoate synthase [Gloeobacter violaceus]|uniref:Putative 8-amino-7-oxononanoate synthase n=1 Tax=Gloeobacter violaceus (strain ATCC 29082 / PCC 7421) TaxID=251221 RepID=BIOF_GLOVI|nr:8-amino-7-oxononanoate synthase [Gloeobacter violaceus]Q7NNL4.1 RecName: Full=Putative 8-amino-7-oxononanoate synthase; Short=AONS; AltName: Full=7-keto-8-amino-pelargonic acid synthase; Short=7-KAP synthase; AltName: Full=8-amino-7-ketopelargonate synthase [Gloeobacter violaceus PCC 7421]BAC88338.1 7-keto-8-aminopelargonic acid synthetase [Gloeobacter violaceus PCC 7421]